MPHNTLARRRLMRIEGQLDRLIGAAASSLFRDACRLADGGLGLESQGTLVWHCAREIESAIREALGSVAPIDAEANAKRIHAAEIEAIIHELSLDETDPAVTWWKARVLSGLAHRASLGPPRPFAPGDWLTYLTALELILAAFESRYLRMIATLDDLLAMTPAKAGKRTRKLLCSVPPTGQATALKHFFERADATWLRALPDCILDDPPGREFAIDQPGYFRWPQWHASRYLAKVAPVEPERVYDKVMKVLKTNPENPWIHIDFMSAAAHFQTDQMAEWAAAEAAWVSVQPALFMPVSRDFADAVAMLASALTLAPALPRHGIPRSYSNLAAPSNERASLKAWTTAFTSSPGSPPYLALPGSHVGSFRRFWARASLVRSDAMSDSIVTIDAKIVATILPIAFDVSIWSRSILIGTFFSRHRSKKSSSCFVLRANLLNE